MTKIDKTKSEGMQSYHMKGEQVRTCGDLFYDILLQFVPFLVQLESIQNHRSRQNVAHTLQGNAPFVYLILIYISLNSYFEVHLKKW